MSKTAKGSGSQENVNDGSVMAQKLKQVLIHLNKARSDLVDARRRFNHAQNAAPCYEGDREPLRARQYLEFTVAALTRCSKKAEALVEESMAMALEGDEEVNSALEELTEFFSVSEDQHFEKMCDQRWAEVLQICDDVTAQIKREFGESDDEASDKSDIEPSVSQEVQDSSTINSSRRRSLRTGSKAAAVTSASAVGEGGRNNKKRKSEEVTVDSEATKKKQKKEINVKPVKKETKNKQKEPKKKPAAAATNNKKEKEKKKEKENEKKKEKENENEKKKEKEKEKEKQKQKPKQNKNSKISVKAARKAAVYLTSRAGGGPTGFEKAAAQLTSDIMDEQMLENKGLERMSAPGSKNFSVKLEGGKGKKELVVVYGKQTERVPFVPLLSDCVRDLKSDGDNSFTVLELATNRPDAYWNIHFHGKGGVEQTLQDNGLLQTKRRRRS